MKTLVVAGALANKPYNGGEAWIRLSWVLGLKKLGFDVFFIEQIDPNCCVDGTGGTVAFAESGNRRYFEHVMAQFGLADRAALIYGQGEVVHGATLDNLLAVCDSAEAIINHSGHLRLPAIFNLIRRRVYVDMDPGFTQFWHAEGNLGARLAGHTDFFTIGENIGLPGCIIPTGGIPWRPTRSPVLLDHWAPDTGEGDSPIFAEKKIGTVPKPRPFTTVASWRCPFGPIQFGGRTLGLKVHEFRKFIALPILTGGDFEIALAIDPGDWKDRDLLVNNGWRLADPATVACGPMEYRDYVTRSGAEFSVAQGVYVDTHSGWFSERTARYLAAGKPALVQDTGVGRNLPTGEGLIVFSTLDEAVAGVRSIRGDYQRHSAAARRLAETHFDSDVVLGKLMEDLGIKP